MTRHVVKIEKRWWDRIASGEKTSELRYDDRDYQAGDVIEFVNAKEPSTRGPREYEALGERRITHVLRGFRGLEEGYVILSLAPADELEKPL